MRFLTRYLKRSKPANESKKESEETNEDDILETPDVIEPKEEPKEPPETVVPTPKPRKAKRRAKKKKKKKVKRKSAAKGNKKEKRVTRILNEDVKQSLLHYAKLGYTHEQLGLIAGCSRQAIESEAKKDVSWGCSLKKEELEADGKIIQSLYKRAQGMTIKEGKVGFDKGVAGDTVYVDKELPPDATSMIFWLKNRQPDKWRDKQVIEGGPVTQVLTVVSGKEKTDFDVQ